MRKRKTHQARAVRKRSYRVAIVILVVFLALAAFFSMQRTSFFRNDDNVTDHKMQDGDNSGTNQSKIHYQSALQLAKQGRFDEAADYFRKATRLNPDNADIHFHFANMLQQQERPDDAMSYYFRALRADPNYAAAHRNMAFILASRGASANAIEHYHQALELRPNDEHTHFYLAGVLFRTGEISLAIQHYQETIRLKPDYLQAFVLLARIFGTHPDERFRDGPEAVKLAIRAGRLTSLPDPSLLDTLAAALAEAGRFPEAVDTAQRAIQLAQSGGQIELAKRIRTRLDLYQAGQPYRHETNASGSLLED